ncbi:hypothetical protein [Actinomadura geliboluensis]|uniref:hypothetical protein n=1 Tax=Actinomadura geliboluensis TaxID=882440 RepID=UPI0036ADE8D4
MFRGRPHTFDREELELLCLELAGSLVAVRGLAVWSEPPGVFRWRVRPGPRNAYACRPFVDLHDVADEVVCHHERGVVPGDDVR